MEARGRERGRNPIKQRETRPNPIKQRSMEARGRKIHEMRERESCETERVERRGKQILK